MKKLSVVIMTCLFVLFQLPYLYANTTSSMMLVIPPGWKIAFKTQNESRRLVEYTPANETAENHSKIISEMVIKKNTQQAHPELVMVNLLAASFEKRACTVKKFDKTAFANTTLPFGLLSYECNQLNRSGWFLIIDGDAHTLYGLNFEFNEHALSQANNDDAKKFFNNTMLCFDNRTDNCQRMDGTKS